MLDNINFVGMSASGRLADRDGRAGPGRQGGLQTFDAKMTYTCLNPEGFLTEKQFTEAFEAVLSKTKLRDRVDGWVCVRYVEGCRDGTPEVWKQEYEVLVHFTRMVRVGPRFCARRRWVSGDLQRRIRVGVSNEPLWDVAVEGRLGRSHAEFYREHAARWTALRGVRSRMFGRLGIEILQEKETGEIEVLPAEQWSGFKKRAGSNFTMEDEEERGYCVPDVVSFAAEEQTHALQLRSLRVEQLQALRTVVGVTRMLREVEYMEAVNGEKGCIEARAKE